MNVDALALFNIDPNDVVQRDRLIDRAQLVEAVRTRRSDPQSEVNLGERAQGDGHGKPVVSG